MHVDDVSRRMDAWLRDTVPGADVQFVSQFSDAADSHAAGEHPCIEVCFQSIRAEKPDRASLDRAERFLLTYLLRVTGVDALASQHAYSLIYFASHESGEFEADRSANGAQDAVARSHDGNAAVLTLTARLARPAQAARAAIVTRPLDLRLRSLGRIAGQVVTDTGTPIMRAEIDAPSLNKRVLSGADGRFVITGAPAADTLSLTVRVRDRFVDVSIDPATQAEIVIVVPKENEHA